MPGRDGLFLHEELLLLVLRDEQGTISSGTWIDMAMGGAILAELMLAERIRPVQPKRHQLADLVSSARMGDPILDECLKMIRDAKKRQSLQTWVSKFAHLKELRHRVARRLAQRGILREETAKVLGIFTRRKYPEVDPGPERRIIARLRRAIFQGSNSIDPRTVALIALSNGTGVLNVVFDRKKVKAQKKRIEKIMNGDLTAKATQEAIQAVQTAIMVAVIIPAVIVPTVISS